ncbi:MAG TPA: peptidase M64 N-terminal domain-containing protein, partial [Terriglobales bacterium]|nr:peptidase M64 N-terminal domain-containing protein [Terriglobales bacterium]
MKRALIFAVLFFATFVWAATPRTMRLDYYHTGNSSKEMFSLDEVVIEPLAWAGNPDKPVDETNLGKYYFEVRDRAT